MATTELDILLVEDRPEDVDLARDALIQEKVCNRMNVVYDGEEALRYLKRKGEYTTALRPDLIVLDLSLPGKSGVEVLSEVRRDSRLEAVPVIILTTSEPAEGFMETYRIAPDCYIRKSADFCEFAQSVRRLEDILRARDAGSASPPVSSPRAPLQILLVEDNLRDVELIEEILYMKEKYRWRITHAADGKQALKRLETQAWDVVVLDLYLPDSGGLDTLKMIRDQKPHVPIIVMTGLNDEGSAISAVRQGAQDYLIKGQISADLFIRSVQYAIERKQIETYREQMLSYVNHELNGPLTIIKEGLGQMSDGLLGPLNDRQHDYLARVLAGTNRLIRITEDLLDSALIEFGKVKLEKKNLDLAALVGGVADAFGDRSLGKKIELVYHRPPGELIVQADKSRVEQVVVNLLSNALKFTQEGGRVEIRLAATDNEAWCAVTDTGPGIHPDDLPRVFNKFERLGTHTEKGAGLGLFICRNLVEVHGGRIWAGNASSGGSCFTFTLPLVSREQSRGGDA